MTAFARTGLGVDIGFYTGPISRTVWNHVRANNQKFVIVQSWGGRSRNEFAPEQLAGARAAGLKTAAYILLNYDNLVCPTFDHPVRDQHGLCSGAPAPQPQPGARWQVRQGLAALGDELHSVAFIAIDVEWFASPPPSLDPPEQARRAESILDALDELKTAGKRAVVYTRNASGHWSDITGCDSRSRLPVCTALAGVIRNPHAPVPLWDMQIGNADLNSFRPLGAWTSRLGRQFRLDANAFGLPSGRTVDLNVFDLSLFAGGAPPLTSGRQARPEGRHRQKIRYPLAAFHAHQIRQRVPVQRSEE